eukprot:COSAG05_NODE_1146_length_5731_cov_2.187322_2_plen_55_part_00
MGAPGAVSMILCRVTRRNILNSVSNASSRKHVYDDDDDDDDDDSSADSALSEKS